MLLYKILPRAVWAARHDVVPRAPLDERDGYMHLSAASQLRETAHKHFAEQTELVLVAIDAQALGVSLRWEVSRGGALFPHVYGPVPVAHVVETIELVGDTAGVFTFPPELD